MSEPVFLSDLTWVEAADALRQRPVGLLPIGAIEAHGPHLPLDTDIIIATETAMRSSRKLADLGCPAVILPPVAYTVSFVGTSFPGTSPVDRPAFEEYLFSLLANLATTGYRGLVCCNAHLEPAHVESIQSACRRAERAAGIPVRSPDQRSPELAKELGDESRAGARHAGAYETSIVLAAKPGAVRLERMAELEPVWIDLPARLRKGARTFAEAGATQGYFGNPAAATSQEGHRLLDALADITLQSCREAGLISGG